MKKVNLLCILAGLLLIVTVCLGAWDKDVPAATTSLRASNPLILANQAAIQTSMDAEHDFGSSTQTGSHTPGSARCFIGIANPTTQIDGGAFAATDLGSLFIHTDATVSNTISVLTATTPTWTLIYTALELQMIAAAHSWGAHQTMAAGFDLLGSTTSDINFGSGNFTVAGATGNTSVGGTFESVGIATLADASVTKTTAAPGADAQIANKKYVDDNIGSANYTPTSYAGEESITFPNGLVFKHGIISESSGDNVIAFDAAFGTAIVSVNVCPERPTATSVGGTIKTGTLATTGFTVISDGNSTNLIWQAWGY